MRKKYSKIMFQFSQLQANGIGWILHPLNLIARLDRILAKSLRTWSRPTLQAKLLRAQFFLRNASKLAEK